MKWIIICILIVLKTQFLIAQNIKDTTREDPVYTTFAQEKEQKIKLCADSINNCSKGHFPKFLFDECFDLQAYTWEMSFHPSVSLRFKILQKVNNKKALKLILSLHDHRLKLLCPNDAKHSHRIALLMLDKTFYQLLEERYKQL